MRTKCPTCNRISEVVDMVNGCPFCTDDDPHLTRLPNESDPHLTRLPNESDPNGKAPVRRGLLEYFPRACMAVAEVSASGAKKYAWNGWETVPEGVDRYGDAEVRHILKAAIEGKVDHDYGHLHAAHEAWNALARLELILREQEGSNVPDR